MLCQWECVTEVLCILQQKGLYMASWSKQDVRDGLPSRILRPHTNNYLTFHYLEPV